MQYLFENTTGILEMEKWCSCTSKYLHITTSILNMTSTLYLKIASLNTQANPTEQVCSDTPLKLFHILYQFEPKRFICRRQCLHILQNIQDSPLPSFFSPCNNTPQQGFTWLHCISYLVLFVLKLTLPFSFDASIWFEKTLNNSSLWFLFHAMQDFLSC